ncbi:MAG TPA: hotdog fold thioesterase [Actinomycetes bacterium]|nr:hotdog fold thioesterase [Actinomycetes bacterium]
MNPRDFVDQLPEAPIHGRLGITITEASIDRVVGTMPVAGNEQPFGALHGGASVVLAESLGSIGSALHAGADAMVSGVDVNATHHRAVTSGVVTGTATPLHLGRTVATWQVAIVDDDGRACCTARITCAIRPKSYPSRS